MKPTKIKLLIALFLIFSLVLPFTGCSTSAAEYEARIAALEERHRSEMAAMQESMDQLNEKLRAEMDERFPLYNPLKLEFILEAMAKNEYYEKLSYDELTDAVCAAYLAACGDPYAAYYTNEEWESEEASSYVGIGVQVIFDTERNAVQVVIAFPDSPADQAGMQSGDYLLAVNGTAITDLNNAVDMIRGEEGTDVTVTVESNGVRRDLTITRARVENVSIMSHLIPATAATPVTGYIRILEFNGTDSTTALQFMRAYTALKAEGAKAFIFDVRYCPGGDLYSVLNITKFIVNESLDDPLARIDYTDEEEDYTINSLIASYLLAMIGRTDIVIKSGIACVTEPIVVLTNGNTASGGELFASTLKDYNEKGKVDATLLGTQTFGKGIMQSIRPMPDGSGYYKLTNAYYNPPFSDNYHGVGVEPDVVLELDEALQNKNIYKITDEEDNQIQAALSILADRLN